MKYIPINGLKFNISFKLHWFGLNDKLVDCLEKCLIYRHIRRVAD